MSKLIINYKKIDEVIWRGKIILVYYTYRESPIRNEFDTEEEAGKIWYEIDRKINTLKGEKE